MVTTHCQRCGRQFTAHPHVIARGGGKYCSRHCKVMGARAAENRTCSLCGSEFYAPPWQLKRGWGQFCSRECKDRAQDQRVLVRCATCGTDLYRTRADIRKSGSGLFFCNHG